MAGTRRREVRNLTQVVRSVVERGADDRAVLLTRALAENEAAG